MGHLELIDCQSLRDDKDLGFCDHSFNPNISLFFLLCLGASVRSFLNYYNKKNLGGKLSK